MRTDAEKSGGEARGFFKRRRAELLCALLLCLMAALMLDVVRQKSITVDEWVMIPAGYYHLTAGDFRPVNEHPPFAKLLSALPLMTLGLEAPPIEAGIEHDYEYFLSLFNAFWRANAAEFDRVSFWARVPMIAVAMFLGALVFVYARRDWGTRAALFAVALYGLEPTVLAHGRVVQTDIPSALALLVFSFALYGYLKAPTVRRAAYVGLAAGLGVVTKFSMVALAPALAVVFALLLWRAPRWRLRRGRAAGQALVVALAAVLAVNAAYLFQRREPESFGSAMARTVIPARLGETLGGPLAVGYELLQRVFPADFVSGVGWQLGHARNGHPAALLGEYRTHGWWYYYPAAFALKTTLPFLLLSLAALAWALLSLRRRVEGRVLVLVLPVVLFTGLLALNSINIGVRYLLPAYPFLCILAGVLLDALARRLKHHLVLAGLLIAAALGWVAFEAARAHPDQMAYVNQLARQRPRWYYLSDSNVEWGDDVRQLALYLRERGERRVGGALLNWQLLEIYGLEQAAIFVPPGTAREETRYAAVGASLLNGSTVPGGFDNGVHLGERERVNYFDEFRRRQPEKVFGNSIYLYRMKE